MTEVARYLLMCATSAVSRGTYELAHAADALHGAAAMVNTAAAMWWLQRHIDNAGDLTGVGR